MTRICTMKKTVCFKVESMLCMAGECISIEILASYSRAGLKIISSLREDASWKITILLDLSKPLKKENLLSMETGQSTSVMGRDSWAHGRTT